MCQGFYGLLSAPNDTGTAELEKIDSEECAGCIRRMANVLPKESLLEFSKLVKHGHHDAATPLRLRYWDDAEFDGC